MGAVVPQPLPSIAWSPAWDCWVTHKLIHGLHEFTDPAELQPQRGPRPRRGGLPSLCRWSWTGASEDDWRLLFSFWAGWPHPAWAGAGAHPAPQQFPGTRASGQPQVVLDAQPLSQGPDAWAALPGPHRWVWETAWMTHSTCPLDTVKHP